MALIPPKHYYERSILDDEYITFENLWIFVGLKNEIPNKFDYLLCKVGSKSLIVFNTGSVIKVFHNLCKHRHSAIKSEKYGNGPLICPYHRWSYDTNGKLKHIPNSKQHFPNMSKDEFAKIHLTEWEVGLCGEFVFVRKNSNSSKLEDYLGKTYKELNIISNSIGNCIHNYEYIIKANWKLIIENTLESYHVDYVHQDSFKRLGIHNLNGGSDKNTIWLEANLGSDILKKWKYIEKDLKKRAFNIGGWYHMVVLPLMAIGTTLGISFSITNLVPISSEETLFSSKLYFTRIPDEKLLTRFEEILKPSLIEFNEKVFREDAIAVENVQKVIGQNNEDFILGEGEDASRVIAFHEIYLKEFKNS